MSALTDVFSNIANAIRSKTGDVATMTPAQMPDAIMNIAGADYTGAVAIEVNGEYVTGFVPSVANGSAGYMVGEIAYFDFANYSQADFSNVTDIYFGDDVTGDVILINSTSTNFGYSNLYGTPSLITNSINWKGKTFHMPKKMKSAEYMLGFVQYADIYANIPDFVFSGNTNLIGMLSGTMPSWMGGGVNIYHPNIEDYVSTVNNNSLFGSVHKPYSHWSPFSWSKISDDQYLCSDFNVKLIRYNGQ